MSEVRRGGRVLLRHPTLADRAEYSALREASRAHLAPWDPLAPPGVDPDSDEAFARYVAAADTERSQKLLVCRAEDGAILGAIHVNEIVRGPFLSAYLGYWIGAPHARRGYMGEALQLALAYAFGELGLHRVEANLLPENEASRALVRRAGFRREGLSLRYLQIAGRWADHERWALLADEWEPRAPAAGSG